MRNDAFSDWLVYVDGRDKRQTSDNLSRVRRVEEALTEHLKRTINLDDEYNKDRCNLILETISFECSEKIVETVNLPKDKNGLSSLRTAVNKYVKFCDTKK
ncbi:hypothetical protein MFMK1_000783 [Metallumcola ferriviriculae]|uniref:Uncharacterized protein n=1 Tax=Metallumcola ferriviriculae TaxID=3039180 RepID=A0AAU0ULA0_9FIRM|nr:hypothetical protein MFMK1_000783 [Desulfitibacteraceae bacterium MK1]